MQHSGGRVSGFVCRAYSTAFLPRLQTDITISPSIRQMTEPILIGSVAESVSEFSDKGTAVNFADTTMRGRACRINRKLTVFPDQRGDYRLFGGVRAHEFLRGLTLRKHTPGGEVSLLNITECRIERQDNDVQELLFCEILCVEEMSGFCLMRLLQNSR